VEGGGIQADWHAATGSGCGFVVESTRETGQVRFRSQFLQFPVCLVLVFGEPAIAKIFNKADTPLRRLGYSALVVQFLLGLAPFLAKLDLPLLCHAAERTEGGKFVSLRLGRVDQFHLTRKHVSLVALDG
jgi:hypothetical protein